MIFSIGEIYTNFLSNEKLHIFFVSFLYFNCYAQDFKIDYERVVYNKYDGGIDKICPTILYTNSEESFFIEDQVIDGKGTEVNLEDYRLGEKKGANIKGDSLGQLIYKNKINSTFKQRKRAAEYTSSLYRNIIDTILPTFDWTLENEFKDILGYKSQKATTTYNGRNITAWFSSRFGINDGPWKFWNVPGLILEVKIDLTENTFIKYEAYSISIIDKMPKIEIPASPSETIKEVEKGFLKKYERLFKYYQTKSEGTIELRKDDLDFFPIIFKSN